MMVDVITGVFGGADYGKNIRTWQASSAKANLVIYLKVCGEREKAN